MRGRSANYGVMRLAAVSELPDYRLKAPAPPLVNRDNFSSRCAQLFGDMRPVLDRAASRYPRSGL